MLTTILVALAGYVPPPVVTPTVSGANTYSGYAGDCPTDPQGTMNSAVVAFRWTTANADTVNYTLKVYKDGILVASGAVDYQEDVTGSVEWGPNSQYTVGWVFRVDVVRDADNVVVSTSSAAPWTMTYGSCPRIG